MNRFLVGWGAICISALLPGCQDARQHGEQTRSQAPHSRLSHQERIQSLEARYRGRIDASAQGQAALDSSAAAAELMAEWNPVGSKRDELKRIMGEPSRADSEVIEYIFASGRGGTRWRFHLRGNLIAGLDMQSIN